MKILISHLVKDLSEINNKELELENKCIDNFRSMLASQSCLVDDLSQINKKTSLIELSEKFHNTCQLYNKDLNKFALLLRKGIYPYEDMDSWEKIKETTLKRKEAFYNDLNKEDISNEDYPHAQKVWEVFEIKDRGEYYDLFVHSDTTLLADMFENFRDKCIEIYGLDPSHFLSAPGLSWQGCLKKTGVKLELLNDNDMLMMFEKGIRGEMWNAVYRNATANNKYMQKYDENIESPFLQYLDGNNQYWWTMSEKFPVYGFKWIEKDDLLKFDENIKLMKKLW